MKIRAYLSTFEQVREKWQLEDAPEINQSLRFQGQYFDTESGLHYNRYRYYSPETARFITPDPIGLAGGLNQTQYVPNPTGWADPLGLASKDCEEQLKASAPQAWDVGSYGDLRGSVRGKNLGLDAHHVGQKAIMKDLVDQYDPITAPSILVPNVGHTVSKEGVGIVSRSMNNPATGKPFTSARDVIARDVRELRRVYPDISKVKLKELIDMNKSMYPEVKNKNLGR
ncbi:RHS repeat-associated core domain-containing protein [Serratia fonticola]|uniref:RHS repeat-associated core domain-containing protein n=1 Tax=Serratia fonticola TaxID=47917 RepID=UPI00192A77AE|nr:RHS repeat-associated core domain-containing protein [Serratia fonticola]MBL5864333.1 RHS repeat-associated core domain-containing protein [Serratia fonticola]